MTNDDRLEEARIEFEKWSKRHAANKVKTTADWFIYQQVMRTYAALLEEALA